MHEVDHIGIATRDLEASIRFYEQVFGGRCEHRETVADQGVEAAFVDLNGATLELLQPTDRNGPLARFLENRGPGLHHICYRVADIRAELSRLKALGQTLVNEEPRQGARGHLVAFVHPKSTEGVLTELCQAAPSGHP